MKRIELVEPNHLHVKSTLFRLEKLYGFMKPCVMGLWLELVVNPIFDIAQINVNFDCTLWESALCWQNIVFFCLNVCVCVFFSQILLAEKYCGWQEIHFSVHCFLCLMDPAATQTAIWNELFLFYVFFFSWSIMTLNKIKYEIVITPSSRMASLQGKEDGQI